ncbi:hypothetical protein IAD21_04117 [Abditibacteriota bacterium]|nr:hypothetical protein IAD21_04117 [Abditibacteriota bacterium]
MSTDDFGRMVLTGDINRSYVPFVKHPLADTASHVPTVPVQIPSLPHPENHLCSSVDKKFPNYFLMATKRRRL